MIREHATTIGDTTYKTQTFPAAEGLDMLPRLISLLGDKAMALFLGSTDAEAGALLSDAEVIAALVVSAAQRAAELPGGLSGLAKALLKYTTADKVRIGEASVSANVADHFDTHFAGRYQHLLEVCAWVARSGFAAP